MPSVPPPWIRRPISNLILILAGLLVPVVFPVAIIIAFVTDLVTRNAQRRHSRAVTLTSALILVDLIGRIWIFSIWLVAPLGFRLHTRRSQNHYRSIMSWWANSLMWVIARVTPLRLDLSQLDESLLRGNAIVIGRHRSLLDAVLPAALLGARGLKTYYVLKEDLRWEPNIDVVGHRMGHVFVTRSPKDLDGELEPIRRLGAKIGQDSVGVIFPEGTFFTTGRRARALASIARRSPERLNSAERMQHLLPPRPAGTAALLEGAPDADLIMLGHVGFEPFGTIGNILANLGADHRVIVRAWRYDRSEVPNDPDAQIDWLFARWVEMDEWIQAHH